MRRLISALGLFSALVCGARAAADAPDGRQLYADACASCHGLDGRGAPEGTRIEVPLPDFTDCQVATREPDADWGALAAHGGRWLGMSPQMPAFDQALSGTEIAAVLDYLRSFCGDPWWPRGELNFRRPFTVTKAFPEDEAVLVQNLSDGPGKRSFSTEVSVEGRVGPRGQIELTLPFEVNDEKGGPTAGGVSDLGLAYKHVLYASLARQSIVSAAVDLVLPTGDYDRGLGDGTTSIEPALLSGHRLGVFVLQTQFRAVLPIDVPRAPRHFLYRFALQYPLGSLKQAVVPAIEFEYGQRIEGDFRDRSLLSPTLYVPLSRRGHIALGLGAQFPVTGARPFDYSAGAFFLWEYLDGGIWW